MVNHYTILFGIFDGVKHEDGKAIPIIDELLNPVLLLVGTVEEFESDNQECNREIGPVWKKNDYPQIMSFMLNAVLYCR